MVVDVSAASGTVIVAGSINVDLIVGVPRLPTAGETVQGDRFVQQNGGKGANQAVAASRVGARVVMLGAVGGDDLGRSALDGLAEEGVDISACRRLEDEHTGLALIVVDAAGENQIAVAPGANARLDAAMIADQAAGLRPPAGSVCLVGFEVFDAAVLAAARWAAGLGLRIILNPAPARPLLDELLALRPILTPNEREAELLSGSADPERAAMILGDRTRAPVIVSLGAEGAVLCSDGRARRFPATPVTPLDTTGAGDALNGILAAELARGASLETALRWAMVGAALKTTRAGAQAGLPTRAAIAAHLSDA
jgi:ribokinase